MTVWGHFLSHNSRLMRDLRDQLRQLHSAVSDEYPVDQIRPFD